MFVRERGTLNVLIKLNNLFDRARYKVRVNDNYD